MAYEDVLLRESQEHRARRSVGSGRRRDDGRDTENAGEPYDRRQHAIIHDQTDQVFSVVRP